MLADKYLSRFQFRTRHEILIRANPDRVWTYVDRREFGDSVITRILFMLRGIPRNAAGSEASRSIFTRLEEVPGSELVLGIVGKFWLWNGSLCTVRPEEFSSFNEPGYASAVWSFEAHPEGEGMTHLTTETRIFCTDDRSMNKFSRYWFLIRPFSGMVRQSILRHIKRKAESN